MTHGESFLVTQLLAHGYGAEDIAVMMEIATADVRAEIARLRQSGDLGEIYKKPRREGEA